MWRHTRFATGWVARTEFSNIPRGHSWCQTADFWPYCSPLDPDSETLYHVTMIETHIVQELKNLCAVGHLHNSWEITHESVSHYLTGLLKWKRKEIWEMEAGNKNKARETKDRKKIWLEGCMNRQKKKTNENSLVVFCLGFNISYLISVRGHWEN